MRTKPRTRMTQLTTVALGLGLAVGGRVGGRAAGDRQERRPEPEDGPAERRHAVLARAGAVPGPVRPGQARQVRLRRAGRQAVGPQRRGDQLTGGPRPPLGGAARGRPCPSRGSSASRRRGGSSASPCRRHGEDVFGVPEPLAPGLLALRVRMTRIADPVRPPVHADPGSPTGETLRRPGLHGPAARGPLGGLAGLLLAQDGGRPRHRPRDHPEQARARPVLGDRARSRRTCRARSSGRSTSAPRCSWPAGRSGGASGGVRAPRGRDLCRRRRLRASGARPPPAAGAESRAGGAR